MSVAEAVRLEGEVLQHPTMPVVKETNMKKKATMKSAIMERPMSGNKEDDVNYNSKNIFAKKLAVFYTQYC
jgi:hypothetical protein